MTNPSDLTYQDIVTLIEALDAWERIEASDSMMIDLIGTVLMPQEKTKEFAEKRKAATIQIANKAKIRKETSVMIKAKLFQMRNALAAASEKSEPTQEGAKNEQL